MSEETNFSIRLSKAAKEFNVGKDTIVEFLGKKGFHVDPSPNTKLTSEMYELLVKEYQGEKDVKEEAKRLGNLSYKGGSVSVDSALQSQKTVDEEEHEEVIIRTNTISSPTKKTTKTTTVVEPEKTEKPEKVEVKEEFVLDPAVESLNNWIICRSSPSRHGTKYVILCVGLAKSLGRVDSSLVGVEDYLGLMLFLFSC